MEKPVHCSVFFRSDSRRPRLAVWEAIRQPTNNGRRAPGPLHPESHQSCPIGSPPAYLETTPRSVERNRTRGRHKFLDDNPESSAPKWSPSADYLRQKSNGSIEKLEV